MKLKTYHVQLGSKNAGNLMANIINSICLEVDKQLTKSIVRNAEDIKQDTVRYFKNLVASGRPTPTEKYIGGNWEWDRTYTKAHKMSNQKTSLSVANTYLNDIEVNMPRFRAHTIKDINRGKPLVIQMGDFRTMSRNNPHWVYYEYGKIQSTKMISRFGLTEYKPLGSIGGSVTLFAGSKSERQMRVSSIEFLSHRRKAYDPQHPGSRGPGGFFIYFGSRRDNKRTKGVSQMYQNTPSGRLYFLKPRNIYGKTFRYMNKRVQSRFF